MGEYLELALDLITKREGAVSADTGIFQLNKKQDPRLRRKLRGIKIRFPRILRSYFQQIAVPSYCQHYYNLARTIMRQREGVTRAPDKTSRLMNEIQCSHLWRVIRVVYNYLSSNELPLAHSGRQYCTDIFEEFLLLVTRADTINQQIISQESWLWAAFLRGNDQLTFEKLIRGLQDCVDCFNKRTEHPISDDDFATIWRKNADMEGDARVDASHLRSRVETLLIRPDLGSDEKLLAQHILQREKSISGSDSQGVDVQQFLIKGRYPAWGPPIGHGASAVVYEVEWLLHETCAKKHFLGVTANEGPMHMKEASILSKLNHPNIVKLLCTSEPPEVSFLMEIMPMNLCEFITNHRKNGITPAAAIDMMLQIAQGFEYMHNQDIAHRDMKASNVLVSPSKHPKLKEKGYGALKLADFGLAKLGVRDLAKPTQEMMGTSFWRAPEAFAADIPIDWKKADVYSFGMACSEILTGDTPFCSPERPRSELYTRIMSGERPKLPSSCPDVVVSLLKKCWSTFPGDRPSFTHIMEDLTSIKRRFLTGSLEWTT